MGLLTIRLLLENIFSRFSRNQKNQSKNKKKFRNVRPKNNFPEFSRNIYKIQFLFCSKNSSN